MCAPAESPTPDRAREAPELGDILRRYGERYTSSHPVTCIQRKGIRALSQCRTAALGGHLEACNRCGHRRAVYHSCRNRHCPKCQALAQADWIEARRADLLPVDYFHVVFTLPHELCSLTLYRPRVIYDLLFRAAADTLATFARDPQFFSADTGGELGITAILHTWGQNLSLHPHLHCVVTGGALASDGKSFVSLRHKGFLFPVRALAKVFRAKFVEGLRHAFQRDKLGEDTSVLTLCNKLRNLDWVVYAKPPFAGPESVLAYLGAYTHRIAISNHRILNLKNGQVDFRYRDYADGRKQKVLRLDVDEFIRRFLLHVLPKGFVRIRHYGLLANRSRRKKIAHCRTLLSAPEPETRTKETVSEKLLRLTGIDIHGCPVCREGHMIVVAEIDGARQRANPPLRVEFLDSS
ncbi:MAG: IS91 family transposase [Myxococcota bacterium]